MKKLNILTIAIALITLLGSCSQDLLDTPAPNISDASFFTSDEAAYDVLVGVYDPLSRYNYSQIHEWMIGDVVSDDAEKGGEGHGDWAECQDLKNFRANTENSILLARWREPYVGINRANKLIEGIDGNENISMEVQKRYIAEAKFLRAWYYFHLVKVFGGVPIVTSVLQPSEFTLPRNTEAEVYAQIEKDLKEAAPELPFKTEFKDPVTLIDLEAGRATRGAAEAMLIKMYIFQEKWSEAATLAQSFIDNYDWYDLEENYADVFTKKGENGVESIFEIQHLGVEGDDEWGDSNDGNVTAIYQGSRELYNGDGEIVSGWGWGFNLPTQDLYNEYEDGDLRREATIIDDKDVLWEGTDDEEIICTKHINSIGYDAKVYHSKKYYIPASERLNMSNSSNNWRAIRFADVLLWHAEANAHTGGDWEYGVNRVRARVGLDPTSSADALEAVYHERRVELAMEGHRYWDLVRTGRGNLMNGYSDNKRLMPIPQAEIGLNPNLEQNPY
ncbi:RagB/SusD family nutrient uptake outer membrane protein [Carboxylicivirga mesophila]|uniref:RagB/SusD family nutrient uptake outer membrane protein n=1 Tax=Carboxylicivirga mesophila TaxID=1166478 RepID=A0ABS5K7A5_9BACT|nr:RagB/SusD family nutrient uptake outer membrane protein [Carboxylicivirga mesophila]MBS2210868.1 RagB/SusD family nutrient uptake outer membrane protein [Carboxylicivirga mesophila]